MCVESIYVEPVSVEPVSVEPVSVEPVSVETVSIETVSIETVSIETVSIVEFIGVDRLVVELKALFIRDHVCSTWVNSRKRAFVRVGDFVVGCVSIEVGGIGTCSTVDEVMPASVGSSVVTSNVSDIVIAGIFLQQIVVYVSENLIVTATTQETSEFVGLSFARFNVVFNNSVFNFLQVECRYVRFNRFNR